jgi:uncharacterized protein (TIGR00255 family)
MYIRAQQLLNLKNEISIEKLMNEKDIIRYPKKDLESISTTITQTVEKALLKHQEFALKEGRSMEDFIENSIEKITSSLSVIEKKFPVFKEQLFETLKERVSELMQSALSTEDHKRLLTETAVYAEKADISEEIVRLKNHYKEFSKLIKKPTGTGKSMNFILQEMHREINTIGSKFNTSEVISDILLIKEEIEKCREIVQNIE